MISVADAPGLQHRAQAKERAVDLAAQAPFWLGGLHVKPALRQVQQDAVRLTLEPRVMQVLVALKQAAGEVVSRDTLIERCWDGRIVGDNAIQRVISRLRHLASTTQGFELETIPRVGYRLLLPAGSEQAVGSPDAAGDTEAPPIARRYILGLAAALVAVGGGLFAVPRLSADDRDAHAAKALVARGREAMLARLEEGDRQAIAYLKRATELDPKSADAWGALALVHQRQLDSSDDARLPEYAAWTRAFAGRALALDPGNVDAKAALVTIRPNFRNWAANEAAIRKLMADHPDETVLESALGWLLCDTGRWREAIACFRRTLALEPFDSGHQVVMAWGLWGGGELPEAGRMLDQAARLWPSHAVIWQTRFQFLASTGQPDAAIALVDDVAARPVTPPDSVLPWDMFRAYAQAMETKSPADVAAALDAIWRARQRGELGAMSTVTYLCAFGMAAECFPLLEGFYFGAGPGGHAPGPLSRRKTSLLFSAKNRPLHRHPDYAALTRRLGLDDYWRATGTRPDPRG